MKFDVLVATGMSKALMCFQCSLRTVPIVDTSKCQKTVKFKMAVVTMFKLQISLIDLSLHFRTLSKAISTNTLSVTRVVLCFKIF